MILVSGAAGNIGSEVVNSLVDRGARVRALLRDPATAVAPGVEAATGDLEQPDSMVSALAGVDSVFLLPGYPAAVDAIVRAGARRIVLLSGGSAASGDMTNAVTRYMVQSETAVRESGLERTFLRPAAFMVNALGWSDQIRAGDYVTVPFADVRTACVDPVDVGAVAAAALVEDGHAGKTYQPTGPDSLLPQEQVAILGRALGRTLHFRAQPNEEAREAMLSTTPAEYVDAFFDFYVEGSLDESVVRSTVEDVTGRAPRTFEQWSAAHTEAFS